MIRITEINFSLMEIPNGIVFLYRLLTKKNEEKLGKLLTSIDGSPADRTDEDIKQANL